MSLSTLYKEIEDKAKVDRSSREIQDISSAVKEMLERLVSGEIEFVYEGKELKFRGADLQPCGSMAEETSLWKSSRRQGRENKFLEFDYVVILHKEDNDVRIESGGCQGCRRVVIGDRHELAFASHFNAAFLKALYSLIHFMCRCHVDPDQTFSKDETHDNRPCPKCTVAKDTGRLQIAKVPDFSLRNVNYGEDCSLVFYWTSYTDSLMAPNIETLQPTERIGRLVIRVDVKSAFTLPGTRDGDKCEKELFIIGKDCPYCLYKDFMVSYCMQELRALKHVLDQHKQCYMIIKFLYGQFIYWTGLAEYINSYHAKVAFLTHCEDCKDEQKDCTTCITEILQSLVGAYRSGSLRLPEFHPVESMESMRVSYCCGGDVRKAYQIPILRLLHVLSQLKTQYRPRRVVGLIKRTCRILLEPDRPGIMDMDGRPLENTVSTEDILAVLLSDKYLCNYVLNNKIDEILCRFDCPGPERGLLGWRVMCMAKMIMASDITHIRDESIKKAAEDAQDYDVDEELQKLLFLTSSQSVTEMSNSDSETSSPTPSLDGSCNDITGWSVPADSIFTDDLKLNWSALDFTELKKKMRREKRRTEKVFQTRERRKRLCPSCLIPKTSPSSHLKVCCASMTVKERSDAISAEHNRIKDLRLVSYDFVKLKREFLVSHLDIATVLVRLHIPVYKITAEKQLPQHKFRRVKRLSEENIYNEQERQIFEIPVIGTQRHADDLVMTKRLYTNNIEKTEQQKSSDHNVTDRSGSAVQHGMSQDTDNDKRNKRYMSTTRLCPECLIPQKSLSNHVRKCCVYMTELERWDAILEEHNREKDLRIVSYEIKQLKSDFPKSYLDIATVLVRSHIPVYNVVTEKQPPQYKFRRIKRLSEEDIDQIRKIDESTTTEIHSNIPTTTTAQCSFNIETMAQQKTTKGSVASIGVKETTDQNRPAQHSKRHRTTIEEGASYMHPGYNPKRQCMPYQGMPEMPGGPPWTMPLSVRPLIQEQKSDVRLNYNGNESAGGATSQSIGHISKGLDLSPKSLKPISLSEQMLIPESEEDIYQMYREGQIAETTPTETNTNHPPTTTKQCITDLEVTEQNVITKPTMTDSEKIIVRKPKKRIHTTVEEVASKKNTEVTSKRLCATELTATPSTSSGITRDVEITRAMIEDTDQEDSDE